MKKSLIVALCVFGTSAQAIVLEADFNGFTVAGVNGGAGFTLSGTAIIEVSSAGDLGPFGNREIILHQGTDLGPTYTVDGVPFIDPTVDAVSDPTVANAGDHTFGQGGTLVSGGTPETILEVSLAWSDPIVIDAFDSFGDTAPISWDDPAFGLTDEPAEYFGEYSETEVFVIRLDYDRLRALEGLAPGSSATLSGTAFGAINFEKSLTYTYDPDFLTDYIDLGTLFSQTRLQEGSGSVTFTALETSSAAVPVPASVLLLMSGVAAIAGMRRGRG